MREHDSYPSESLSHRIGKDTFATSAIGLVTRISPLLSTVTIAAFFARGKTLDAYYLAVAFPVLLAGLIGMAVSTVFVPVLVEEEEKNRGSFHDFLNSLFSYIGIISLFMSLTHALIAPALSSVVARGFDDEGRQLTAQITLQLSPIIFFITIRSFLTSVYHSRKSFLKPAFAMAIVPLATVLSLLLFYDTMGIHAMVLGNVSGFLLEVIFLLSGLPELNIHLAPTLRFDQRLTRIFRLSTPQVLSTSVLRLNPLADRTFASLLAVGSVRALTYGERIHSMPLQIMNLGFFNVLLAHWSFASVSNGISTVKKNLFGVQRTILIFILPLTFYLWLFKLRR